MINPASTRLMVWDGKSIGTLLNVYRLLNLQKKAVIYSVPLKQFREFRDVSEWDSFFATCDGAVREKVEQRARTEAPHPPAPITATQASLSL